MKYEEMKSLIGKRVEIPVHYDLTYDEAVKQATERAKAEGFGVVVMRHFDKRCYVASNYPGTDIVLSFPVDANGLRIDWPEAHRIRAAAHNAETR